MDKKEKLLFMRLERTLEHHRHFDSLVTDTLLVCLMFLLVILTAVLKGMPAGLAIFSMFLALFSAVLFLYYQAHRTHHHIRRHLPELHQRN